MDTLSEQIKIELKQIINGGKNIDELFAHKRDSNQNKK